MNILILFYLSRTFQESKNSKFDEAISEMVFYLFTVRKRKGIWALLTSLNSREYILKQ